MKKTFKSMFDSWVTSLMGVVVYLLTTAFIWKGTFSFLWEGVAGYAVGTTLLMFPKSIEGWLSTLIKNKQNPTDSNGSESV